MITIGRMAEKYGMLPSEVISKATTYDLMITDVLVSYDNYQMQQASGKLPSADSYSYSVEEMKQMMEKAREQNS